jgi:hypothetical protein
MNAAETLLIHRDAAPRLLGPLADGAAFTMMPDEEFAALIRSGTPVSLDAEDLSVLRGGP